MTVQQVGNILDVNSETVRRWIRKGELKATMNSRKKGYIIDEVELEDFIRRYPKYEKRYHVIRDARLEKIRRAAKKASEVLPIILMNKALLERLREEAQA